MEAMSCSQCQIRNVPLDAVLLPIQDQSENFLYIQDPSFSVTVFDHDARKYFLKTNESLSLEQQININDFIKGLKKEDLWEYTTCWTFLSTQIGEDSINNKIPLAAFGDYDFFIGTITPFEASPIFSLSGIEFKSSMRRESIQTDYPIVEANNSRSIFLVTQNLKTVRNQHSYLVSSGNKDLDHGCFNLKLSANNDEALVYIELDKNTTSKTFSAADVMAYSYNPYKGFVFWSTTPEQFSTKEYTIDTSPTNDRNFLSIHDNDGASFQGDFAYSFILNSRKSFTARDFTKLYDIYKKTIGKDLAL